MDVVIIPLFQVLRAALDIYEWIVVAAVIFSWLYTFNVINTSNRLVGMIGEFTYRTTEPILRHIRGFIPAIGGFDFSPIVLLLAIFFLQNVLVRMQIAYQQGGL